MNIIKLQDILKGVPDDRLQKELQSPTGEIPSYLVLSEVVRRDKLRQSVNAAPSQSSVLEDAVAKARSAPMPQQMQGAPEEQPQQETAGYADGGFISPNNAMAQSGVRGFQNMQKPPQQQIQLGASAPSMFSPNLRPKPAPVVSAPVNVTNQGYQPDSYQPDDYQNNSFTQSAMARGGIVALADGDMARSYPSRAELVAYIREAALKRGMDPDIAVRVAESEGLNADPAEGYQSNLYDDEGNREESYSVFQLNMKPSSVGDQMLKTTGIHPRDDVFKSIDFALDTANKEGWGPWMGAAAVDITGKMGTAGGPTGNVVEAPVGSGMGAASEGHSPDAVKAMQEDESFLSTIGDMFGGDAVKMGKILMNKQEEKRVPLLDLSTRGDPKAAASTRTRSPAEILEAYRNLRGSYMAHGGQVQRMNDGPPGGGAVSSGASSAPMYLTAEEIANMTPEEIEALSPGMLERLGAGLSDVGTAIGSGAMGVIDFMRKKNTGEPWFGDIPFLPKPNPNDNETIRQRAIAEGLTLVPYSPEQRKEAAERLGIISDPSLPQEQRKATIQDYTERDAEIARIADEAAAAAQQPEEQTAVTEEAAPAAAPKEKGVYDLLREMQTATTQAEQDYYDEMIRMEEEKAKQSGGLGGFLRQMGLGMMASPGNLQQQLIGGLYSAGTAREEAQAERAGKLNEYRLAKKKADIEAIKSRIQLQVDEMTAGQLGPKDKATLAIRMLEAKLKDETDPAVRKIIMEEMDSIMRDIGVNIPTYLPEDENKVQDTTQGFFQKYVPNFLRSSE
jgi:hypothetical protein